jgi:hypothetical protein
LGSDLLHNSRNAIFILAIFISILQASSIDKFYRQLISTALRSTSPTMVSIEMKVTTFLIASILLLVSMSAPAVQPAVAATVTPERLMTKRYKWEIDSAAMLSKSTFKIKPAKLIEICKEVIDRNIGLDQPNDLAEDFAFQFPVIGPLSKKAYLE